MSKTESRKFQWKDLLVVLLLFSLVLVISLMISGDFPLRNVDDMQEVPVPADKLIGSAGVLRPEQKLNVVGFVPDADGTPVPQQAITGKVSALLGDKGETLLLAVPTGAVPELQALLINDSAKLAFYISQGTATPTPDPAARGDSKEDADTGALPVSVIDIPIPNSLLIGGTGSLDRNQTVGLIAYMPNALSTLEPTIYTYGEVLDKEPIRKFIF